MREQALKLRSLFIFAPFTDGETVAVSEIQVTTPTAEPHRLYDRLMSARSLRTVCKDGVLVEYVRMRVCVCSRVRFARFAFELARPARLAHRGNVVSNFLPISFNYHSTR